MGLLYFGIDGLRIASTLNVVISASTMVIFVKDLLQRNTPGHVGPCAREKLQVVLFICTILVISIIGFTAIIYAGAGKSKVPDIQNATKSQVSTSSGAQGLVNYTWASRRLEGAFWGMASGDIDGDGRRDIVLLKRRNILVGRFDGDAFIQEGSCNLEGQAEGARVYTMDLDSDGDDEIVISAVEGGMPASLILDFEGNTCITILDHVRWSLRGVKAQGQKLLLGQGWTSQSFFSGPVVKLATKNGGLKEGEALDLPRNVDLYEFEFLPSGEGMAQLILLKGYAPMEAVEKKGKRFKRFWKTGMRMGGSANLLSAEQRLVLDEISSSETTFDTPPLVIQAGESFEVIAPRLDMPLKGVIGKRPAINGAQIIAFRTDPVFGFVESWETVKLPAAITDIVVEKGQDGRARLLVLLQDNPSVFHQSDTSFVLAFDLH